MTSPGSRPRLAAQLGCVLALAACAPRPNDVGAQADAAVSSDAGLDAKADAGETRCVPGGTTSLEPIVVACAQPNPARIVLDGANVYWTTQGGGPVVMKAALAGGAPVPLAYHSAGAAGLAVDAAFVYYTLPSLGRVMRVSLLGGPPVALATGLVSPLFLALGEGALYWTGGVRKAGVVMRLELREGAKPTVLIDGQPGPRALAVQGGFVTWTDANDGSVLRMPAAGAAETTEGGVHTATRLASGLTGPSDLVLADGFVYVIDQAGRVARVPVDGGALETFVDAPGVPFGLATDGISLYWSTLGAGGIFRTALRGDGHVDALVRAEADPHFLAVGDVAVFWGTWGAGGAVKKTAK